MTPNTPSPTTASSDRIGLSRHRCLGRHPTHCAAKFAATQTSGPKASRRQGSGGHVRALDPILDAVRLNRLQPGLHSDGPERLHGDHALNEEVAFTLSSFVTSFLLQNRDDDQANGTNMDTKTSAAIKTRKALEDKASVEHLRSPQVLPRTLLPWSVEVPPPTLDRHPIRTCLVTSNCISSSVASGNTFTAWAR